MTQHRDEKALEYAMADDDMVRRYLTLTPREKEMAHLMVKWSTNKEMAREMGISPRTAEVHRASIFEKLEVRNASSCCVAIFKVEVRALANGGLHDIP